jgi:hypothetical protein
MDTNTLLIIIVLVFLLGGGGFFVSSRRACGGDVQKRQDHLGRPILTQRVRVYFQDRRKRAEGNADVHAIECRASPLGV